jgi:PKD repeat protein
MKYLWIETSKTNYMKKNLLIICMGMLCLWGQSFAQSVSFNTSTMNGCAPLPVNFTNTSSVPNGNYCQWSFGDGSPNATIFNPSHTFNNQGNYNVQLSVFDTTGHGMLFKGSSQTNINVNGVSLNFSGDTVCPGEVFTASVNQNANNYSWSFGDGATSNQSNVSHTYASAGIDTLKLTVTNNCGGIQHFVQVIHVKVNGHPNADFSANMGGSICPNDILQFYPQNQNASSYSWNFGDAVTSTQSQPTHSYTTTGTFTVSLTVTSSCGTSTTHTNTVNVSSHVYFSNNVNINSSGSQACPHDVVNFNCNTQALSMVWKFGTTDSLSGQNVSYSWPTPGTYTVTAKLHNGCGNDTTISKVIQIKNNMPFSGNVGMQMGPNPACPNDVVYFQSSSASSYKWYFGDAAHDSSSLATPQFSYAAAATYTVGVKLYNGCGRDTLITSLLTINNSTPAMQPAHSGNNSNWGAPSSTSCSGDTVIFYAQGGMGSLHWNFGDGATATGGTLLATGNGIAYLMRHVYTSNNTYKVKLTVVNGCANSASDSLMFVVGGSSPVNGSLNLTGNGGNNGNGNTANTCQPVTMIGAGGSTYHYLFGNGDSLITHSAQIAYSYPVAGNYTITLKVTNGCGNSATYTKGITINGMNPSLTPTNLLCNSAGNGKIVESVSGGYAPYTYSINGGPYQTSATFNNLTASTYTVTIKDSAGCKVTSVATLNQPTALALAPSSVNSTCGNANGSASVTMSGGTPAYIYSWQAGGSAATLSAQHSGSYLVTVTDANGCTVNATIAINDVGGPVVTYTGTQGPFCVNGGSVSLTGGSPAGGTYVGSGISAGTFFSPSAAGVGVHTIDYTVTSGGCTSSHSNTITVNALPNVSAFSNPVNGEVCTGGSVTLTGGGASTYSWSGGRTNGVAFVPVTSVTYTVTGTDANNCSNTASLSITVNPYPTVTLSFTGHDTVGDCLSNVTLSGGSPAGGTYSGNGVAANSFNPSSVGDGNYSITYSYTTAAGCMASHTTSLHVQPCPLGVVDLNTPGIKIYPNPGTGFVMVETPDETGTLEVMNAIGQVIYTEKITQTAHLINLGSQPGGMYLVKIEGVNGVSVRRILLNK